MTAASQQCIAVAQRILDLLETGIAAGPAVTAYMDSTLNAVSLADIAAVLGDGGSSDRDTLLDLLFFPEEDFQTKLEPMLVQTSLTRQDTTEVQAYILRRQPKVPIAFPDGCLIVPLPDFAAASLVSRLRLDRRIDSGLADAIRRFIPEHALCPVRVWVRNAVEPVHREADAFLVRFFETTPFEDPDFNADLRFALGFLAVLPEDADIFSFLAARRQKLGDQLQKAEKFMARLRDSNMETMMAQGYRPPGADMESIRYEMRIIDRLTLRVLGRTAWMEQPSSGPVHNLPAQPDADTVREIMKILS